MELKKKILIIICIVILVAIVIFYFFTKNNYKTVEFGNTNIKSVESIKEYILNISSYEADISLEVISNKNNNVYRITQKYASPNIFKQEVMEPENIKGLTTTFDGNHLKIENTNIGLSEVFKNYKYITENSLCLSDFIEEYKTNSSAKCEEKEDMLIMQVKKENNESKYITYKKLYINKNTAKPVKMEIQDKNQKMLVYILYNEIKINTTNKDEVLAFKLKIEDKNI